MTNATQSLHPFSALSQESPGMLWAPVLDVYIASMQFCAVPWVPMCRLGDTHPL